MTMSTRDHGKGIDEKRENMETRYVTDLDSIYTVFYSWNWYLLKTDSETFVTV